MKKENIIIYSYYSPEELTGIGKYNGELIDWLLSNNEKVVSFSNPPFYPNWKVYEGYKNFFYSKKNKHFTDIRSYTYVPKKLSSFKKIISEFSFAISSFFALLFNLKLLLNCKLFIVVNPPFFLSVLPIFFGKIFRFKVLTHLQDLQINAAQELGLLPNFLCNFLSFFEKRILENTDFLSTISIGMQKKIEQKTDKNILLIPNWSKIDEIIPKANNKWLHNHLNLSEDLKLIVYSGNLGEKQGLEIILEAAKQLEINHSIHFVIIGEGLYKNKLIEKAEKMEINNLTFSELVELENLRDMITSSYLQLVIQKSVGADSFLPSKLTNILAAGAASIVTANPNTTLHNQLFSSLAAEVIPPDSSEELSKAIVNLLSNPNRHSQIQKNARQWAENNLAIDNCLKSLKTLID